jgi:hypothetical protein
MGTAVEFVYNVLNFVRNHTLKRKTQVSKGGPLVQVRAHLRIESNDYKDESRGRMSPGSPREERQGGGTFQVTLSQRIGGYSIYPPVAAHPSFEPSGLGAGSSSDALSCRCLLLLLLLLFFPTTSAFSTITIVFRSSSRIWDYILFLCFILLQHILILNSRILTHPRATLRSKYCFIF